VLLLRQPRRGKGVCLLFDFKWFSVASSAGGEQQSVATPQSARGWTRPPCRHFNIQSCCCLGSAFEVAALQTLTLRLTCAGGRGGGVHRGCRRRARRCLVVRGRHCVRCALLPSARAHTHAALAFRWIAVRESGALRQLVASKTRPCLSTKLHVVSTDPEKSSSLGPMLSSHAGARCGIITGTMQLPGHDAQGTEVECSLSDDLTVRSPTRACRRPCARGVGVVAYPWCFESRHLESRPKAASRLVLQGGGALPLAACGVETLWCCSQPRCWKP
jgi:hypothetical protein